MSQCPGVGVGAFSISNKPVTPGSSGVNYYLMQTDGVIHYSSTTAATTGDSAI